jgi:hypothetical protein
MRATFYAALLIVLLARCDEDTIERPLNLPVQINGQVYAYDEFGYAIQDKSNVTISIEGSNPEQSTTSGANGNFMLETTTGTYNIRAAKPGFVTNVYRGVQLLGGEKPYYFSPYIIKPSTTTVTNLTLVIGESISSIKGVVNHNYPYTGYEYRSVRVVVFIKNSDDVSSTNYDYAYSLSLTAESGDTFETNFYNSFPSYNSGEMIYAKVYGIASSDYGYVDPDTRKAVYTTVCPTPSNIASAQLP